MFNMLLTATDSAAVTKEMLDPIVSLITSNIAVIMPVGITVFGIMIGIGLVPKIIKKFTRASGEPPQPCRAHFADIIHMPASRIGFRANWWGWRFILERPAIETVKQCQEGNKKLGVV